MFWYNDHASINSSFANLKLTFAEPVLTIFSQNQEYTYNFDGIAIFEVEANSSQGTMTYAYFRDTTTTRYVAAIQGVGSYGGQIAMGFPVIKGHTYKLSGTGYTSRVRVTAYPFLLVST